MKKHGMTVYLWLLMVMPFLAVQSVADSPPDIMAVQQRWAEVNYQLSGAAREQAFEELAEMADQVTTSNPESAGAWTWSGIIKSTFAGVKGGLGALGLAKSAKADLERAIELDPSVMHGAALTSLGVLYLNVPGWPVGFGDKDKARELLEKGVEMAPHDIDANYFMAEYHVKDKNYAMARRHLELAASAPARAGREVADAGRQAEIRQMLLQINDKN